jgi:hypothetical protein
MVPSLVLGTALLAPTAAPVPADTIPTPTSPAPQVAYLKAEPGGEVWITGYAFQKQKVTRSVLTIENGQQVAKPVTEEQNVPVHFRRQLTEVGGKITTAEGTELSPVAVARRLRDGAAVLISADGKPVEKGWLRAVSPDTLVIVADSMVGAVVLPQYAGSPGTLAPRLVLLTADPEGKVRVAYNPDAAAVVQEEQVMAGGGRIVVINGRPVQRGGYAVQYGPTFTPGTEFPTRSLEEVKFDAYELDGQAVRRDEAVRRLKAGGLVLIAGDARLPDPDYLKLFRGDLLVLVSPELALPLGANTKPGGATRVQPVPGAVPVVGGIQIPAQAVPAVQPLPAPGGGVKVAPAPKPADEKKPAKN